MGYVLAEIVLYLLIAGLIGFVVGWFVRGEFLSKAFNKNEKMKKEPESAKEPASKVETSNNEISVSSEVIKEEVKVEGEIKKEELEEFIPVETTDATTEVGKPTLLSEAPEIGKDQLSLIKGIGPVLERKLNDLGVYTFKQIASWDAKEEIWIGTQMFFPKKVTKEEWVSQAQELLKTTNK